MSYTRFEPTVKVWETIKNVVGYLKENKGLLWQTAKVYLPFIFIPLLIQLLLDVGVQLKPETFAAWLGIISFIMTLLSGYGWAFLAMAWHRICIQGSSDLVYPNPLAPKKSEMMFILYGFLIFVTLFVLIFAAVMLMAFMSFMPFVALPVGTTLIILAVYIPFKMSFLLPNQATGQGYRLGQLLQMMKGLYWKLSGAMFTFAFAVFFSMMVAIFVLSFPAMFVLGLVEAVSTFKVALYVVFGAVALLAYLSLVVFMNVVYIMLISNYFMIGKARYEEAN